MKKLLQTSLLFLMVIFGLTACGNPPEPYSQRVPETDLTDKELQTILNDSLISLEKKYNFYDYAVTRNGCITYNYSDRLQHDYLKNCYIIVNGGIKRIDKSYYVWKQDGNKGPSSYISRESEGYSKFINNLQSGGYIENEFKKQLEKYMSSK